MENNVKPDCENGGSYDTVVYCTVCNAEVSRVKTTVDALGHTDGAVVVENEVDETCTTDGSYDNVTYCTVCGDETSRNTVTVKATGHSFDMANGVLTRPYKENGVWKDGYYTYSCKNNTAHKKTEAVKRADYTEYDKLVSNLNYLLTTDELTAEDKQKVEAALANGVAENLVVSEQSAVNNKAKEYNELINEVYPDAFSTLVIEGAAVYYTGSVINLKAIKMPVGVEATNVTWTSSDESIVFFSNGRLFAVGTGTVTLTATSGILTASKTVSVVEGTATRSIKFRAIEKMHYIIEDYYAVYNQGTLRWSDADSIKFRVRIYQNFPYETYIVYINGVEAHPDENGYYTVEGGTGDVTVTVSGAMFEDGSDGTGSKWSFWEWLLNLLRKIINFFKNLFGIE